MTLDKIEYFYDKPIEFDNISNELKEKLTKVPDYNLDYNIFILKGIRESRIKNYLDLKKLRLEIIESVNDVIEEEEEQDNDSNKSTNEINDMKIYKGSVNDNDDSLELTTAAKLQERLLELLIIERHKRDIKMLNELISSQKKKEDSNTETTTTSSSDEVIIKTIKLNDPHKYEIKSPIFKMFDKSLSESYIDIFRKFAILQNIEYEYEHYLDINDTEFEILSDDKLLNEFLSNEDLFKFDLLKNLTETTGSINEHDGGISNQHDEAKLKELKESSDEVLNSGKIIQIMLPEASKFLIGK
ncbi:hypothetical protein B5S28_g2478 [[Candida] boidinii]|nr:hypothetical protein B5S28_g2478 [[Candida] boidinii]OWB63763.1 hypothetical protein B5S29_g4771 [[Candida] boidinii]OWB74978.1 hypothetical protein B5S31_g4819 [[Candida] boidinii]OWB80923.1 hypothetical protein B5S32_g5251 [[Candida] boidinii]